jgi:hypothetical protein
VQAQHQLNISLSPKVATPGTPFTCEFDITPGAVSGNADLYAAVLLPDNTLSVIPYQVNISVDQESSAFLSDFVLPSILPQGNYSFGTLLVQSNADIYDSNTWVSNLAVSNLYFSLLSPAQQAFINEMGYPEQFIKSFDEDQGQKRVDETWMYVQDGLTEYFINGVFIQEETLGTTNLDTQPRSYKPEDYNFDTTVQHILSKHGQPIEVKNEAPGSGTFFNVFQADTYYVYSDIIFGFNNDSLVSVIPVE